MSEEYLVEDGVEVDGTGVEVMLLSFNAPSEEGEYVIIVDIYYQEGEEWLHSGQDDYYITLTVSEAGGIPGFPAVSVLIGSIVVLCSDSRYFGCTALFSYTDGRKNSIMFLWFEHIAFFQERVLKKSGVCSAVCRNSQHRL